jgi:hypothetical protein
VERTLSRRQLAGAAVVGALVAATEACDKNPFSGFSSLSCLDASALTPSELQIRNSLAYSDVSADPEKACVKCLHFLPGPEGSCGTCRMIRGPIHPKGTCKSFVQRIIRK